jgi:LacI family transcriptional regulator
MSKNYKFTEQVKKMKTVNSTDIARQVGVSRSTVSKVINGYPSISEETRKRVLKAIDQSGYTPDLSGRMLTGKGTETLALLFFTRGSFSADLLVGSMLSAIIETAAKYGYHILSYILHYPLDDKTRKEVRDVFLQRRADAAVIIGPRNDEPLIEELIKRGCLVSIYEQVTAGHGEENRIIINQENVSTAYRCMEYLHSLGHRKVGILNGDLDRFGGRTKKEGYIKGIEAFSLNTREEWIKSTDFGEESGYESMKTILSQCKELPTAFAMANDAIALGAMRALAEEGFSIPEDISVIGIDDHPLSAYVKPGLTTFSYDRYELADHLVRSVISKLRDPQWKPDELTKLESRLIERESCRRIN